MQSFYPERFERDMGTTEAEWLMRLPLAIGQQAWRREGSGVVVVFDAGQELQITWEVLAPRVIALMRTPRLWVRFAFEGLETEARQQFMRRFDLTMQRGGG